MVVLERWVNMVRLSAVVLVRDGVHIWLVGVLDFRLELLFRCGANAAKFAFHADEGLDAGFREFCIPSFGNDVEDREGAAGAKPALSDFFKVIQAVLDVSLGGLVGKVEQVYRTGSMYNVDDDVANLSKPVGATI